MSKMVSLCWMHVTTHSCVCLCVCLCADLSLVRFISAELTRGYFLEHNEAKYTERREKVYTCLRIPKELEKVPNTTAQNYTIHTQWNNYRYSVQYHSSHCFIYLPTKRIKTIMKYYNDIILLMLKYVPNTPLIWKQMCLKLTPLVVVVMLMASQCLHLRFYG